MALAGSVRRGLANKLAGAVRPISACTSRGLTQQTLPALPYEHSALEPVISAEIMKLHHDKHHNTYVTTLNQSYEKYADAEAKGDVAKLIELQQLIKFNGGGGLLSSEFRKVVPSSSSETRLDPAWRCVCRAREPQHFLAKFDSTQGKQGRVHTPGVVEPPLMSQLLNV